MKIAITARNFFLPGSDLREILTDSGFEILDYSHMGLGVGVADDVMLPLVQDADCVIAGLEPYRESLLAKCPKLQVISRRGIGYDSVDIDACSSRGIAVYRTFGAVESGVAEHVMAYILHHARKIGMQNEPMHRHEWTRILTPGAKGRTLGLIGFGGIGKEIARRANAFGMRVVYYCRHPEATWDQEYQATYLPMDELLRVSDYVSLNVPLTPDTVNLIGERELAIMKPSAVLINIARSPVADVQAIADALKTRRLAAAYVDVYPKEPCTDSPLADCDNAVLTPHTASYTEECFTRMNNIAAENVIRHFTGNADPACRLV